MNAMVFRLIAIAASLLLASGRAAADDRSVSITFVGQLPRKCVLNNPNPAVDLGQLSQKGSASVYFSLSCNADFHFALSSQNGGLAQQGAQSRPPFIGLIPYTVSFNLGPKRISEAGMCRSGNMTGQFPSCSGFAGANIVNPSGTECKPTIFMGFFRKRFLCPVPSATLWSSPSGLIFKKVDERWCTHVDIAQPTGHPPCSIKVS